MNRSDELRTWYLGLSERDRRVLLLGSAAIAVIFTYLLILHPFYADKQALRSHIREQRDLVAWMRPAAVQIQTLRGQQPGALPAGQSLLALVDTSAGQAGFGPALKQVQTGDDGSVRVELEGVSFDSMMLWLGDLQQRYGIAVHALSAQRSTTPGTVDANLTLVVPAS